MSTIKKNCTQCKALKPLSAFNFRNNQTDRMPKAQCKICEVARCGEYRKTEKGIAARVREHKRRFARHYRFYKAVKANIRCCRCSESDPACIDFHHLKQKAGKRMALSSSLRRSVKAIIAEFCKCVALCANCHRKLHAKRFTLSAEQETISVEDIRRAITAAGLDMSGRPLNE